MSERDIESDRHIDKRARLEPRTPERVNAGTTSKGILLPYMLQMQLNVSTASPPRLNKEQMETTLATAFEPYCHYIKSLAEGALDGYLDSNDREKKLSMPGFVMSDDPNLLLHGLGDYMDMEKINSLFAHDTVYVLLTILMGR
jgi:hypothetical protein